MKIRDARLLRLERATKILTRKSHLFFDAQTERPLDAVARLQATGGCDGQLLVAQEIPRPVWEASVARRQAEAAQRLHTLRVADTARRAAEGGAPQPGDAGRAAAEAQAALTKAAQR